MLVLSRENREKIIVKVPPSTTETRIEVVVVRIRGTTGIPTVRIGIEAPKNVNILRAEVPDRHKKTSTSTGE